MEFVVLLSVFAITFIQVSARPTDTEDLLKTKDGNDDNADGFEGFKFKLPTAVKHNFGMIINGTLNMSHKNFIVSMPVEENEEHTSCKLIYNYEKNSTIEVSPLLEMPDETGYSIFESSTGETDFILNLQAKESGSYKMFELTFEAVHSGRGPMITCKIDSFDELNHILFKEGVKKITSILFTF